MNSVSRKFYSENRKIMIEPLFRKLDKTYAGYEPGSNEEKNVVRDCLLKGIVDLCFNDSFNPDRLNRNKGIEALKKIFSDADLKSLKEYLAYGRDNLDSIIKRFHA